jgi:hypothetical protein
MPRCHQQVVYTLYAFADKVLASIRGSTVQLTAAFASAFSKHTRFLVFGSDTSTYTTRELAKTAGCIQTDRMCRSQCADFCVDKKKTQ